MIVYILDFGIARRILNDKDELKTPRATVCFKGTVRFASMACHKNNELGPKDDCESWFYLLLDLIITSGLPWKKIQDRNEVLRVKEECRKDKRDQMFHGVKCKESFGKIMDYIDALHYHDRIDYSYVYDLLKEAAQISGARLEDSYDWEDDNTKSRKRG
ncbi:hypothetical protein L596_023804 [Steinernema carpocapsae]|uniref:Protein kinase domain-containing protein n=1 Tax=Steinernema carpocapsae TaxID=34508 RepID=A0A4U5MFI8_STECR|nr:hypothetical protein L596_023804 [Steinernema carpocapsae]